MWLVTIAESPLARGNSSSAVVLVGPPNALGSDKPKRPLVCAVSFLSAGLVQGICSATYRCTGLGLLGAQTPSALSSPEPSHRPTARTLSTHASPLPPTHTPFTDLVPSSQLQVPGCGSGLENESKYSQVSRGRAQKGSDDVTRERVGRVSTRASSRAPPCPPQRLNPVSNDACAPPCVLCSATVSASNTCG